jgi:hypothetical protein
MLGDGFFEADFRLFELAAQFRRRVFQVVAPCAGGAGIGRVGEMARVANAGPLFLRENFAVEIGRHPHELGDHRLDLGDAPALLVDLEALQPNKSIPRLHFTPLQDTNHTEPTARR